MAKIPPKQRQLVALQPLQADKKPYLVRGMPRTTLYLTGSQAAKRLDLIPQFQRTPLQLESATEESIVFRYLIAPANDYFVCRVAQRITTGE